jgi:excinuclease UvrABC nuclease subunit
MKIDWSVEHDLDHDGIRSAPSSPGVYEILQESTYPRYKLATRVIKIGMSKQDLQKELDNHLQRHTTANRIKRIKKEARVTFRFAVTSADDASQIEKELLKEFEDRHWDVPVCNSTRGYGRNEDSHYG